MLADDVRSCTDATDSSGTLTNDDTYVTPRTDLPSVASLLQVNVNASNNRVAAEAAAKQCMLTSRCSACNQVQTERNPIAAVEGGTQTPKTESPQLSDEEHRYLELQRSHGAIPKCRSDHRPCSHSGKVFFFS